MTHTLRGRAGFTLVELTLVICIIAILAAILFPVFARAQESARKAACAGNLYQIGVGLQMYARDYDGRLPPHHNDFRALDARYARDPAIFRCPTDEVSLQMPQGAAVESNDETTAFSSYQYRAGLTLEDRPDIPVAGDWEFRHSDGAAALFLSGSVKWFRRQSWTPVAPGPRPMPPGARLRQETIPTSYLKMKGGKVTGVVESPEPEEPSTDQDTSQ